ncbi:disease resistance RPP13-like protein 4 [Heracleum sosnowskyi]|uniref:Disease resistance RPP13-like protein 4 n=1 Tax=Heracleum sosnowskyi TaxID=360622 RepID=A0AAD8H379_9APIA|nr:disease resistance RPP13-like protein 4 [Heracleum sosnowskyi]
MVLQKEDFFGMVVRKHFKSSKFFLLTKYVISLIVHQLSMRSGPPSLNGRELSSSLGMTAEPIKNDPVFISVLGDDSSYDIAEDIRQLERHILLLKPPRGPRRQILGGPKHRPSYFDSVPLEKMLNVLDKSPTKSTHQFVVETHVPRFFRNPTFENSAAFRDIESRYNALSLNLKLCLLCFSVFPLHVIIKKRLMVFWWMAEGFIEQPKHQEGNKKDLEQLGAEYFVELMKKDFIKPYHDKRRLEVQACKMPRFIHSVVITIAARAKFFDFDSVGRPQADCPSSFRLVLVKPPYYRLESYDGYEKFHLVFNLSENVLCLSPEWIRGMKNVTVLYLGRWRSRAHYIQVMDVDFLKALSDMKHLRLLNLREISNIVELPDEVTKLEHLMILDLRACEHLQKLPRDIGLLKSLTHLDLSDCYMLYWMPKGLSKLKNLLVLKGFVVVEPSERSAERSCSLVDLSKLPKLRKLSIFVRLNNFPGKHDLDALQQLRVLTKLKVVFLRAGEFNFKDHQLQIYDADYPWSSKPQSFPKKTATNRLNPMKLKYLEKLCGAEEENNQMQNDDADFPQLPARLQKLELKCFHEKAAPRWLNPMKLKNLEKLYITGGNLSNLGGNIDGWNGAVNPWGVKVLRLKYLTDLAMHWKEVPKLFPKLIYLEKLNCPKLTFFPCDEAGVWINKEKVQSIN